MSPRSEEQNALIKDERREQILSAALKVFATRGFAATKIGDISARADVSHGLVYHYFKSKEEIFFELLKRAMETSSDSVTRVEPLPLSPLEKVRTIVGFILGGIENFEDTAYYFMIVTHASVMDASGEVRTLYETSGVALRSMERILSAGQAAGEINGGDTSGMTMALFAAIQGLAAYKLAIKDFKMPDPEILVNMVKSRV